jgi:hypothetical protein
VRTRLAIALLVAASMAGCGGASSTSDLKGDSKDVAEVIEDLQDYAQRNEADQICKNVLDAEVVKEIAGGDCIKTIEQAIDEADNYDLTVDSVRVTGTTARARVKAGRDEDQVETIELRKNGDAWKITRLAAAG